VCPGPDADAPIAGDFRAIRYPFMRAVVCKRYGPPEVLELQELDKPSPKGREVLIKIHATSVSSSDWIVRSAMPIGSLPIRMLFRLAVGVSRAVAPGGKYVSVDDGMARMQASDLTLLAELVTAQALKPVIDRHYRLDQIAEAHRYVEQDHKKGNVVVTVPHDSP
jgi:NADPH:quinone reductase-like Zn-dependent oxidoreductase